MVSTRVSEALNPGSIPGEATNFFEKMNYMGPLFHNFTGICVPIFVNNELLNFANTRW